MKYMATKLNHHSNSFNTGYYNIIPNNQTPDYYIPYISYP